MSQDDLFEDRSKKKEDENLQEKIDDFNLFLEELESEWVDESEEPAKVEEPQVIEKPVVKPKSPPKKEAKAIPKPRPIDPSTQEIHVDLETGEVTFDDLDALDVESVQVEEEDLGTEALDELLDTDVSETIEIDEVAIKGQVEAMEASVMPTEIVADEFEITEEKEKEDEIIFGAVVKPKKPEQFAHNYLFARFPVNFMLVLVPQVIGMLVNIFVSPNFETTEISVSVDDQQNDLIDTYLLSTKLSLVILLAFFLCYRWSTMQNDGSYGYWITQGVNRRKFFIETIYKFMAVIYFGIFAGLLGLIYLNGIYLEFLLFLKLNLLIISHIFILLSIGIIIGVLVKNPESASLLFIILFGINYAFNTSDTIWNKLLQSDLQYKATEGDLWFSLIASLGLGFIISIISLRVHLTLDMEL
ncbi:MAG: hypothetical protein ACW99A_04095 [Candidatus Kariarchaeaceae archaeon]|jgi:hypothetical protein